MRIAVVTPAARGSHKGNRVTALRWVRHLRALGHRVTLGESWAGRETDLLVALHATKAHPSIVHFRERQPRSPLVVGLGGTDLYQDLPGSPEARRSLELATRVVVLQPLGLSALPPEIRPRARAIVQSAQPARPRPPPAGTFRVCLLAHVRAVKDAFLAPEALRALPARSRLELLHLGAALDPATEARALQLSWEVPRYRWAGERRRRDALELLAGSALLLVTSRLEGGSNAVSEAIACGVPVLSTRVDGSVGVLGPEYPGYFPVGDAGALAAALERVEEDPGYLAALRAGVERARPLVEPARERAAWRALLAEVT